MQPLGPVLGLGRALALRLDARLACRRSVLHRPQPGRIGFGAARCGSAVEVQPLGSVLERGRRLRGLQLHPVLGLGNALVLCLDARRVCHRFEDCRRCAGLVLAELHALGPALVRGRRLRGLQAHPVLGSAARLDAR
ncbi:MAG: hypothetical protein JNM70_26440 [Anaerolineae bacterium]|nr:hypothetical protein [Anaerolineae bacterium]